MKKLIIILLSLLFIIMWAYLMFMPKYFVTTDNLERHEKIVSEYQKYEDSVKAK